MNTNSLLSNDFNAKESIAAQTRNDLEDKLNHLESESVAIFNDENENSVKQMSDNTGADDRYDRDARAVDGLVDGVERSAQQSPNGVNSIESMNAINDRTLISLQNEIKSLQNDIFKMEEEKQSYRIDIEVLHNEVTRLRAANSHFVNREAVARICDKELLYKLIVSQLFYDGYRDMALTLSNAEKMKQLCPPSDRLHNLVAIALKAEADSPSLSDDGVHPTNLIDLDFEGDRSSLASRAFSPDDESGVGVHSRLLDVGRMISKSQSAMADVMADAIAEASQAHSESLSPRSTPDLSSFGGDIRDIRSLVANGMASRTGSRTPNVSESEMSLHSGLIQPTQQQLDLSDLITQINLAQMAFNFNTDPTSVATSSANTPSPTPINLNVPLENSGLVLNEAAIKNLNQLAKMSANEVQNGLMPPSSTSPSVSLSPPIGRCSSTTGTKPNVMQIRCKFGQLGGQKGQFSSPHGFCLGVEEEIVIADTNNHRICIFDKSGDFKHSFGVPGKDEAQLWYPRKVAIIRTSSGHGATSSPRYVICDRGAERSRMQIFTRSGHFVRKIAIRYIDIVAGLAITPNGHIVAVDSVSPTVFVIAESGDLLRWFDCSEYMREPSDIAINNHEYYICDFKGHCVVVFNDEGQYMRKIGCEGLTSFPNGIDISDAGDILVGDSHGNRFHVVVFDRNGTLISEFECPYVKVSRCCGLKITSEGYVVTLAKNNHHVLILNTLYIQ